MPITNALDNARRLEELGFNHTQAHGLSQIIEEAAQASQPDLGNLVTRDFLHGELNTLRVDISRELRAQMVWFFTMQIAILGVAFALLKLFP
jgi:hypothetical protein